MLGGIFIAASELFRTGTERDHIHCRFHASKYGSSDSAAVRQYSDKSGLFDEML